MATQPSSTHRDFYVYALFRETGEPFYIGKGHGFRVDHHEWEARRGGKGHKCNIIRDMEARGFEVIKLKIHDGLSEADAHKFEIALIKAIGRGDNGPLVNLTDGGDGPAGWVPTPENRAKMSAAKLGRKLTAESIAKRSAALRGRTVPDDVREKISAAQRGVPRRKLTPEEIERRSASVRGSKRSVETRLNMSAAQQGNQPSREAIDNSAAARRGKKLTTEHVAKVAKANRGMKRTPEARAKMAAAALCREAAKRAAKALLLTHRQLSFFPPQAQSAT